jgi:hypothetical protein
MENEKLTISELVETESWKKFNKKLELYGSIVFIIGFILLLFKIGKPTMFVAGLSSMACAYFFIGFNILKTDSKILSKSFYKFHGLSLALAYITIMFSFMNWPFPVLECIYISGIGIIISIILGLRAITNGIEIPNKPLFFIRLFATIGLLIYSYFGLLLFK